MTFFVCNEINDFALRMSHRSSNRKSLKRDHLLDWLGLRDDAKDRTPSWQVDDRRLSAMAFVAAFVQTKSKRFQRLLDMCRDEGENGDPTAFDTFLDDFQDKCLVTSLVKLPAVGCPATKRSVGEQQSDELRVIDQCQRRVYEGISQRQGLFLEHTSASCAM